MYNLPQEIVDKILNMYWHFNYNKVIEEINGTRLITAEQIDELIGSISRSGQFIISRDGQRLVIRYRT